MKEHFALCLLVDLLSLQFTTFLSFFISLFLPFSLSFYLARKRVRSAIPVFPYTVSQTNYLGSLLIFSKVSRLYDTARNFFLRNFRSMRLRQRDIYIYIYLNFLFSFKVKITMTYFIDALSKIEKKEEKEKKRNNILLIFTYFACFVAQEIYFPVLLNSYQWLKTKKCSLPFEIPTRYEEKQELIISKQIHSLVLSHCGRIIYDYIVPFRKSNERINRGHDLIDFQSYVSSYESSRIIEENRIID